MTSNHNNSFHQSKNSCSPIIAFTNQNHLSSIFNINLILPWCSRIGVVKLPRTWLLTMMQRNHFMWIVKLIFLLCVLLLLKCTISCQISWRKLHHRDPVKSLTDSNHLVKSLKQTEVKNKFLQQKTGSGKHETYQICVTFHFTTKRITGKKKERKVG